MWLGDVGLFANRFDTRKPDMPTETLSGSYAGPVKVGAAYTNVTVTSAAYIGGGGGLESKYQYIGLYNAGMIKPSAASNGVDLLQGGAMTNVGTIVASGGGVGVLIDVKGGIDNGGLIEGGYKSGEGGAGVYAAAGVSLTNTGTIAGGSGGMTSNHNYSYQTGGTGVIMTDGTGVSQSGLNQAGLIQGGTGAAAGGGQSFGERGGIGVVLEQGPIVFTNQATIVGGAGGGGDYGGYGGAGVNAKLGGSLVNSGQVTGGQGGGGAYNGGTGGYGVSLSSASLTNTGTITGGAGGAGGYGSTAPVYRAGGPSSEGVGTGGSGVLASGQLVTNEALIQGGVGASGAYHGGNGGTGVSSFGPGVLINSGTVAGGEGAGGARSNGHGGVGVDFTSYGYPVNSLVNTGTVRGGGSAGGAALAGDGVYVVGNGAIDNAAANALISGYCGVFHNGYGSLTVTNYGTIAGIGPTDRSVVFNGAGDRLIAEAGSVFEGAVVGGGGTLDLTGGSGTITGLGAGGAVSGSEAITFTNFNSFILKGAGSWTLNGASLAAGQSLTVAQGSMGIIAGNEFTLVGASLVIDAQGTLSGGGTISLDAVSVLRGGDATAALTNTDTLVGAGFISGLISLDNAAGGVIDASTGRLELSRSTVTNTGLIETTGAGSLLIGRTAIANAGGTVTANKTIELALSTITRGAVSVSVGAVLVGKNASAIDGAIVTNAGTLDGASGGLTISGDVGNSGRIEADRGDLTITGAVTGMGQARISGGGVLEVDEALAENVTFADGGAGTLVLGDSGAFTGTVAGFSKTGANTIDLKDIAYNAADKVSYSTATGALTIANAGGTVLATIKLKDSYAGSTFELSNGGANGTVITDPKTASFASAMAGFGAGGGSSATTAAAMTQAPPLLATPMAAE
jgi:fibronectin-binding autotransporter adhesin